MDFGTPPRGTRAAAAFASPSSPAPRRPEGVTPNAFATPAPRGASSPSSPFSPAGAHSAASRHGTQRHGRLSPTPSRTSADRYVAASTRQGTSLAHFLLTSRERHTPMAIRAAQQLRALRSPSRDPSSALLSASSSLDDAAYGGGTAASPRPRLSLSRAGSLAHTPRGSSAQLSGMFAKMHLDPASALRSSRDRSGSSPSLSRHDYGDDDGAVPGGGSPAPCAMELEPYTSKLARTLFADVAQTTVLPVNDTALRPQQPRSPSGRRPPPPPRVSSFSDGDNSDGDEESRARGLGVSAVLHGPQTRGGASGGADENDDDEDAWRQLRRHGDNHHRSVGAAAEEDEAELRGVGDLENLQRLSSSPLQSGRVPLATSDVNLFGTAEGARFDASLGVVFECNRTRNFTTPSFRVIPHTPERILDAADMEDDFYMNLIDWSATSDVLGVALQNCVYLWNAKTCGITELPRIVSTGDGGRHHDGRSANASLVCGLNWAPDGCHLAVGCNTGAVEVWDVETQQLVHTYRHHLDRTVSLAWEPQGGWLLASGSRDSTVVLRDVRERDTADPTASPAAPSASASVTAVLRAHETEVCGLKWSPTGAMLASGGNDNQLLLWDRRALTTGGGGTISGSEGSLGRSGTTGSGGGGGALRRSTCQPVFYLNQHTAAVKALCWNPAQPALLASGGGSHDKTLRFWNAATGECVHHINTGSQICGVVWNRAGTELVTAHGYTDNQLSIWRYPSLRRIANLIGHTSRVLHLALSADGQTVVSAAGDETLRFWRCFPASELRESSPHLYRSGYSAVGGAGTGVGVGGGAGLTGGSSSPGGAPTPSPPGRPRTRASARCGSLSQDRGSFSFLNEEVELR